MASAGLVLGFIAVIGGLSISGLAIVLGIRHDRQKREMEHLERMKALEFGRTLPQDEPWLSPAKIAALIGAVVPLGVFVSVGTATTSPAITRRCGSRRLMRRRGRGDLRGGRGCVSRAAPRKTSDSPAAVKPYVEEDAYDVVSSRG